MKQEDLKIIFFGTPEFAVGSLDALLRNGYNVVAVVTMPDKAAGRGHKLFQSDIKRYALAKGLPVLQPDNLKSPEFISELKRFEANLFIVIAFRMLPKEVWTMPEIGTFNLHGSLLPKYRGAAPINWAIINGEKETGVTTFFLKHEIDTGDIILQKKIGIEENDNVGTIHDKLMRLGADAVLETVEGIVSGTLVSIPQPDGDFSPAPKIFKETCKINWSLPSLKIHNLVRGLSPYPAAWTEIIDKNGETNTAKVFFSKIAKDIAAQGLPGEVVHDKKRLLVITGDGVLEILELQPSGKKRMTAQAFLLGYSPEWMR